MNVVGFMVQSAGPEALGWFKEPIKSVADLQKRRFRTPPGIPGAIYKEMGVPAVFLPGGEIIPSAERGVLDGAEWCCPVTDIAFGFQQAFKHYYLQGLHQNVVNADIYINRRRLEQAPPGRAKAIFEIAATASLMEDRWRTASARTPWRSRNCREARRAGARHADRLLHRVHRGGEEGLRRERGEEPVLQEGCPIRRPRSGPRRSGHAGLTGLLAIQKANTSVAEAHLERAGAK